MIGGRTYPVGQQTLNDGGNMENHTPGPWTLVGDYRVAAVYAGPRRRTFICEVSGWGDALLIASAPQLLASVEELVSIVEACRMKGTKRITARARKAVARATGTAIRP